MTNVSFGQKKVPGIVSSTVWEYDAVQIARSSRVKKDLVIVLTGKLFIRFAMVSDLAIVT
jgi:hypothetical protein